VWKCARMKCNYANCLVALCNCAVAHLRGNTEGGPGWAMASQIFGFPSAWQLSFLLNFTFKFVWLIYSLQQISFTNKILNDLKTFWQRFWRCSQAYVGLDRFDQSKSIFIITENHHAGETFILASLLFFLAPQCPPVFSF